jgi:two-component system, response regulator RegA
VSIRWLLVDDDEAFRSVLSRALQRRGHVVHVAADSVTALDIATNTALERVVLDLKLNQESGLALIKPLLACQPGLEIVVLTGYASISTAVEAIQRGAQNYLCKPVDTDAILAAFTQKPASTPSVGSDDSRMSLRRLQWEHIQSVLQEHGGNISAAARALGLHRRTLQRRLSKRPVKD